MLEYLSIKYLRRYCLISVLGMLCACAENTQRPAPLIVEAAQVETLSSTMTSESVKKQLARLNAVQASEYLIAPGDKFNVFVYGEKDLETKGVIVKNDGTLSFKLIGEIQVAGLNMNEARDLMEKNLSRYIRHPNVSLLPYEMRSASITIIGKVSKPGIYYFDGEHRVIEAIGRAGGLSVGIFDNNTIELADLEHSYIKRGNDLLPINLAQLIHSGEMNQNIPLIHGDYIYIASAMSTEVFIVGEVNQPGYFGYGDKMTLARLVSKAEGILDTANSNVIVVRGNIKHPQVYKINIKKILKGETRDFPIQPNDIVYVPKSNIGEWNVFLKYLLPSLEALLTSYFLSEAIYDVSDR